MSDMDYTNEDWIIDAGDDVIQRKAKQGPSALTRLEWIIYCVWVADYGMRNAGDLTAATDVYAPFKNEAEQLALELDLPLTRSAFRLPVAELEARYFDLFEGICDEIRAAI